MADRGLDAVGSFVREGGDPYAYVSVDALLVLMNLDGDLSCDTQRPNWKSLIAAIQGGNSIDILDCGQFFEDLLGYFLGRFFELSVENQALPQACPHTEIFWS